MPFVSQVGVLQEEGLDRWYKMDGYSRCPFPVTDDLATCCDPDSLRKTWLLPCGPIASLELN